MTEGRMEDAKQIEGLKESYADKFGFHVPENYTFKARKGLDEAIVREISWMKQEPEWMLNMRLKSLEHFFKRPMPNWGADLSSINFDDIYYFVRATDKGTANWDEVPAEIKDTFDKLGIPEAERQFLAGSGAQFESEMVYHKIREDLQQQGVIFLSMDDGLREHEDLVKEYFGTVIPYNDNKFAALNTAVWSGGTFMYVPKGVHVQMPLQAYFRINTQNMGQFERTLMIIDEGAFVHYVEGCTAPIYSSDSLHSAVVEIIVKQGGRARYTTIQNWSNNVYNLVTKRAVAYRDATMEWVDGNLGCVAQGETVTTPTGIKAIEDLDVGDKVLSYDETAGKFVFRSVVAKKFSGYQPVHTVSIGERKLNVTANHPFYSYVYNADAPKKLGRYNLAYVRADHLTEAIIPRTSLDYGQPYQLNVPIMETTFESKNQYADNLVMTRERPSRMAVDEYTTDDLMWLFGYWVGDGNIEIQHGKTQAIVRWAKVGFSTPVQDRARGRLMDTMTALIDVEPVERHDGHHLAWNSKELAEFFNVNGFEGKAIDKRLPEWVWSLPQSQRLAFVAGYLDADGSVSEGKFHLKSVNRELLEDVASLLVTLGITSRLYTEFSEPKTVTIMGVSCLAHGSHRLTFANDARLHPFVSNALREKALSQPAAMKAHRRTIGRSNIALGEDVEIVPVQVSEPTAEPVPTWDIEVEGTGNFVCEGFIVHNSKITMKYPAVYLMEPGAHGEVLSIAFAGKGQIQDAGGKVVHVAPNTTSKITSKSISKDGGQASYRGLLKVHEGAHGSKSNVVCDALLLDDKSRSDTYPVIEIDEQDVNIGHEASVSKVGEEQLFYLMSRGLSQSQAEAMVVNGFIEPLVKELPMEYALELNRLIQLQMEGSIG
jgi:Fe-S cluster assembly scaffold protein SufB